MNQQQLSPQTQALIIRLLQAVRVYCGRQPEGEEITKVELLSAIATVAATILLQHKEDRLLFLSLLDKELDGLGEP
jgi:hypothetical protein